VAQTQRPSMTFNAGKDTLLTCSSFPNAATNIMTIQHQTVLYYKRRGGVHMCTGKYVKKKLNPRRMCHLQVLKAIARAMKELDELPWRLQVCDVYKCTTCTCKTRTSYQFSATSSWVGDYNFLIHARKFVRVANCRDVPLVHVQTSTTCGCKPHIGSCACSKNHATLRRPMCTLTWGCT
jgi:hypothetical protein